MFKKIFDFTHKITEETYHPSGYPYFQAYENYYETGSRDSRMTISLHLGTHIDAPWHFIEDGKRLNNFHIKELMGFAVILDFSSKYGPDVGELKTISVEDLKDKLKETDLELREREMIIIHTGWHKIFYSEPLKYYKDYCTLSSDAGNWLASKGVSLVGIDTCDVDEYKYYNKLPSSPPNHTKHFLSNNIFIIENVGGEIELALNRKIFLIVAPLNIGGFFAASSPIRLIGCEV